MVKQASIFASTFIGICLLAGIFIFRFGPEIELTLLPPLKDVTATLVKVNADATDVLLTATKARSCLTTSISAISFVNGEQIKSTIVMLDKDGSVLPVEKQRVGVDTPFVRLIRITPGSAHVIAYGEYSCHGLWILNMKVFEIDATKINALVR